jgi:hypothetical protein
MRRSAQWRRRIYFAAIDILKSEQLRARGPLLQKWRLSAARLRPRLQKW